MALFGGWKLKVACTEHAWDRYQYTHSCYNDIYALWFFRGLNQGRFPYLHSTPATRAAELDVEYPVGTGLYMGAVAKTTSTAKSYFNASAAGLAIAGLVAVFATALLAADPRRALYFALAPTLVLYAFHNWDLLAVALTALALLAYHRRRDGLAGVALGIGASTKLFPAFVLPVLMIARWREHHPAPPGPRAPLRERVLLAPASSGQILRSSFRMLAGFAAAALVANVPIAIVNWGGWLYPWSFQSHRFTNYETFWYMIFRHAGSLASQAFWFGRNGYPRLMNVISGGVFVVGSALLIRAELRRDRFRPLAVSFGVLLVWLLASKVYSPQYMLWLLPFFVLLEIPWYGFVAFAVTDAAVWAAVSALFLSLQYQASEVTLRYNVLEGTVYARYLALAWLLWMSRRAAERVAHDPPADAIPIGVSPAVASEA